jgi:hypothetical protein
MSRKKKTIEPLSTVALSALADEAIRIDREMARDQARLKAIKAVMTQQAELYKTERKPTEGGGWSWTVEGERGVLRVTKAGETLRAEISESSDIWPDVVAIFREARKSVNDLFAPATTWKPLDDIRADADELLGRERAERLLDLITSTGKTTVSFETKRPAEAAPAS